FSSEVASSEVSDWTEPTAPKTPPLVAVPLETVIELVPRLDIRELILALAPCVNVRAAITAATPINMPRPVSKERRRLAQSASIALPKLAPMALLRLKLSPRLWKLANGAGVGCADGRAGGGISFLGFPGSVGLLILAFLYNLYLFQFSACIQ